MILNCPGADLILYTKHDWTALNAQVQRTFHLLQEKDDLLSRFVKMSKQGDSRFGDRALRDIMVNYILAGKDSTSAAICWTMYMLTKHPDVRAKVRQELATLQKQQTTPGVISISVLETENSPLCHIPSSCKMASSNKT